MRRSDKRSVRGNISTFAHLFVRQVVTEHALMLIVTDNIDVACATIEEAAMERAVAQVDDAFSIVYADRRLQVTM